MIDVKKLSDRVFEVNIDDPAKTTHEVTIPEGYWESLTDKKISREDLIRETFEFMLERQSQEMILRKIDLLTVARNFPEYEMVIKRKIDS